MSTITADIPQDLMDRALQLPPASREKLGQLLLESLAPPREAVRELLRGRIDELVRGEAELIDAEEIGPALQRFARALAS